MHLREEIAAYCPKNEQEQADKKLILGWLDTGEDVFTRENKTAHFTASGWVVSPDRKQVLLAYHKIYDSWAWLGGHADGEQDLCSVARREVMEESGLTEVALAENGIFSLEILTVDGHVKRGSYVSSHLHLNVTYLFTADPNAPLRVKEDENTGVAWFPVERLPEIVSEPWMLKWIYRKLSEF